MTKPKLIALSLFVLIFVIATATLLSYHKNSANVSSLLNKTSQHTARTSDQSTQSTSGQTGKHISSSIPLAANLPSGVRASTIESAQGKDGKISVIAISDGKTFSLIFEAKLADPGNNQSYTAWIAKSNSDTNPLKLGELKKDNETYNISFSNEGDFSAYRWAIVTLQDGDGAALGPRILEGSF